MTALFSIMLFSQNALAQSVLDKKEIPDALMFSIDDMFSIESAIADSADFSQKDSESHKQYEEKTSTTGLAAFLPYLHLSTIMYYEENNWTIWINGTPYKHDTVSSYFRIIRVSANYVELSVKNETGTFTLIKLKPNQTFIVVSRKIEEGRKQ